MQLQYCTHRPGVEQLESGKILVTFVISVIHHIFRDNVTERSDLI